MAKDEETEKVTDYTVSELRAMVIAFNLSELDLKEYQVVWRRLRLRERNIIIQSIALQIEETGKHSCWLEDILDDYTDTDYQILMQKLGFTLPEDDFYEEDDDEDYMEVY